MSDQTTTDTQFEALLQYLKRNRGFDFTGYKRSSLMRRVEKRMQSMGVGGFGEYVDYLEVHPDEFLHLFNSILINVTAFFRDQDAWEFVEQQVIPRILSSKAADAPVRVWSAGCASGEEPYTLAMLFAEAMDPEAFRERVKIYATDVDEDALTHARQGSYGAREVAGIPPELLEKYAEPVGGRYVLHKDLRRAVIFGRHDLLKDAPISRVDLLVCRNALMYFNAETQAQVLARFNFALNENGFLFLGKAELLFTHANLFSPVDLRRRVFSRVIKGTMRERLLMAGALGAGQVTVSGGAGKELPEYGTPPLRPQENEGVMVREQAFAAGPVAQVVVDLAGGLAMANDLAREMFHLNLEDIGRPLQDLEISYRPVELRSCIEQAYAEQRTVEITDVLWSGVGGKEEQTYFDIQVAPLRDAQSTLLGVGVTFIDTTHSKRLQQQLERSNRELEVAYEELQSTNEELETTNEELQSTVEELETTNEELQSTNEELETMNEELQSTNEELQTINEELQDRSAELNDANAFLSSILSSMRGGVIVLNRDLHVQVWNQKSEDLWGVRADEVRGKHLLNLDIGLPTEELKAPIRACLSGASPHEEVVLEATNRRGRAIRCRVNCSPLHGQFGDVTGAFLIVEED